MKAGANQRSPENQTSSRAGDVFLIRSPHHDLDRIVRQRSLQRLGLIPRRTYPDIPFFVRQQDDRPRLRMDWLDNGIRRCRRKPQTLSGPGIGFDFAPRSPLNSVQMPAKQVSGRSSLIANQTTSFFLVSGFGSGAYGGYGGPAQPSPTIGQRLNGSSAGWRSSAVDARRGQACPWTPSAGRATRRSGSWSRRSDARLAVLAATSRRFA